jgi:hypothetical protein
MTTPSDQPAHNPPGHAAGLPESARDIAEVPALEIVSTAALHLMSAAAVNLAWRRTSPSTVTSTRPAP